MTKDKLLTADEINQKLAKLSLWQVKDTALVKVFEFPDFNEALKFVNKIGGLAEKNNHHPNIKLSWGRVEVSISTHSAGGITQKDFKLAEEIDEKDDA